MTPTNDQITDEAWARYNKQQADQIIGQCKPVEHYIIEVVREGWTPPVDPDLLVAREIAAKGWGELSLGLSKAETAARVSETLAGSCDTYLPVRAALAAYKAGREAEAERARVLVEPAEAIVNRAVRGTGANNVRWPHILKAAQRLEKALADYKA